MLHFNFHIWWTNLTGWLVHSYRFLRLHVFTSTRFSRAISHIVWLLIHNCGQFALALYGVALTICWRFLSLGSHIICLALLVALVSCVKSLVPRYKFLASEKDKSAHRKRELLDQLLSQQSCSLCEKSVITRDYDEATHDAKLGIKLASLYERLLNASRRASSACSSSVTNGDIQSIYRGLAWSSTRSEFESVYWFNHTIQTLWPSLRTLISKALIESKKSNAAAAASKKQQAETVSSAVSMARKNTLKSMMIKERDIQSKQPKLSVYLSCRRQLELLRKNKELVMRKGDEYLGQKVAMMLIYLMKKFILCAKQCFVEQLAWLVEFASSFATSSSASGSNSNNHRARQAKSKVIELDLKEILRRQNVRFRVPSRQTKSAPEPSGPAKGRRARAPGIRFKSAPAPGLACNSRRIVNAPGGLIRFDGLKSLHAKRQKLARSINQMLVVLDRNKQKNKISDKKQKDGKSVAPKRPPLIVERLEIGHSAPRITSIKFVEKEDRHLMAEILRKDCPLPASNTNNMRLVIELTYASDSKFNIKLSSVPLLDQVRLTRFELRLRLLVSINHKDFDDHKNLSIIDAIGGDHLLPILNHVQLSLVDMPRLDWHLEQEENSKPATIGRRGRQRRLEVRSSALEKRGHGDLARAPIRTIKRSLQPVRLINHAYFKYLIHAALFCLQKWFQPFDIRVGDLVYLKTLW